MQISTKTNLIYVVKSEDTLCLISQKFRVDAQELKSLNNLQEIEVNDVLLLPKAYEHMYVVKPLDTYEKIAEKLGVSVQTIKNVTKGKKMFIGQKILF